MNIQCPHCHKAFKVDETDYAAIQQQVRNAEFENEIERRMREIELHHQAREKARVMEMEQSTERKLSEQERAKQELRNEIEQLKSRIENFENEKRADMAEVEASSVKEMTELKTSKDLEIADLKTKKDLEIEKLKAAREREVAELKGELEAMRSRHEAEILKARDQSKDDLHARDQTITTLTSQLESQRISSENTILELNERHNAVLKAKDEEIERYRDLKSKLSTKMLGETLEQHCLTMFNMARSHGQYPNAYFEKDNDTSVGGTKGDFIFRDYLDGEEYISIMFEMKNEDDRTATKHRNEDFFAKLDKDRREKKCEYAILVTTLEADNELYNEGIVDVSYRYDKMLVVRPQFFMSVISLLSRAASRGARQLIALKEEVAVAKAQSIDVTRFEERRDRFVEEFGKLVDAHIKKQDDALAGLDKAIEAAERQAEQLRKIKALFESSRQKLIRANEKAENDFTIRKLTHGNPTMRAKFLEARSARDEEE